VVAGEIFNDFVQYIYIYIYIMPFFQDNNSSPGKIQTDRNLYPASWEQVAALIMIKNKEFNVLGNSKVGDQPV
jgi:hypothetical protein